MFNQIIYKFKVFVWIFLGLVIAACSQQQMESATVETSQNIQTEAMKASVANSHVATHEKLGTRWGDDISSPITQVDLKRMSETAISEVQVRYAGKQYQGQRINSISLATGKISFSIVDDAGRGLQLYRDGQKYYLSANDGQSYQLRYVNSTNQTFEIVASVDGLDVLDGSQASRQNSGYVLRPYDTLVIEGFRKSNSAVASFTFSKPKDAYAANSTSGSIRNTGIIGTVVYELKAPKHKQVQNNQGYAPAPNAFPAD